MHGSRLQARRVAFSFPEDLDTAWTPRHPEVAVAANSVSLLMPHVEPYFVRSIRAVIGELEPSDQERARQFIRQEMAHHAEHRRFNGLLLEQNPGLERLDAVVARTYGWLGRTRSARFNVAFAAASETIAFSLARWTEKHMRTVFDGADEVVATLFLWHLAEEVEHKSVAFDVHRAVDGSRSRYSAAAALSLLLLTAFTAAGSLIMLKQQRRLCSPVAWFRLARWSLSVAFEVLPDVAASAMPGHHPDHFSDPTLLTTWLEGFDPATATMPLWRSAG
jgi:uncharacterized protein